MLQVTEIYKSLQGESSWAGLPCSFVRLTGCPLRCRWCDTAYGFQGGKAYSQEALFAKLEELGCPLVELTGGEPLAQEESPSFLQGLVDRGYQVLLETGGSLPIKDLPKEVHVILDVKCPGSAMAGENHWENLEHLKEGDELKFVLAHREDFLWALELIRSRELEKKAKILLSPAWGLLDPKDLAAWILEAGLFCRLNLQQHKYIWGPRAKGV